jgi:hypothetical protein
MCNHVQIGDAPGLALMLDGEVALIAYYVYVGPYVVSLIVPILDGIRRISAGLLTVRESKSCLETGCCVSKLNRVGPGVIVRRTK